MRWYWERTPGLYRRVSLRLGAVLLAVWLLAMALTTAAVAELLAERFCDRDQSRNSRWGSSHLWRDLERTIGNEELLPGELEYWRWEALNNSRWDFASSYHPGPGEGWLQVLGNVSDTYEGVTAMFDENGNLLEGGEDLLYFPYALAEHWSEVGGEPAYRDGYAKVVLDLETLPEESRALLGEARQIPHAYMVALRLTGVLEGAAFRPAKIEYIHRNDYAMALEELGPTSYQVYEGGSIGKEYNYTLEEVLARAELPWQVFLEDETVPAETVLYTTYPRLLLWSETRPAWDHENRYGDLTEFLLDQGPVYRPTREGGYPAWFFKGRAGDFVTTSSYYFYDYGGPAEAWDYETQGEPPLVCYMVTAIHRYPYEDALRQLRWVYLWSFLAVTVLFVRLYRRLRRELLEPVVRVNTGAERGWERVYVDQSPKWPEGQVLLERYREAADTLQRQKNELTRLQTALDYARNAEENRRRMTSHIAHELKTPLAVVHSYAEGLQAHIAEEKRERYLSVILGECERMDGMVLEMLDLSRLEAGKVTLARDDFDLSALAAEVFQRLTEGREVILTLSLQKSCMVNADRARIEQVITNFASNALRHTPPGGEIRVRTSRMRRETTLSVENQGEPLAPEALNRVWDTFYRGEGAPADGGTGLGLAIARSIIELHGGRCGVRNTPQGVEFFFVI